MVEAFAKPALAASNSAVPKKTAVREVCILRFTFQLSEELILLCKGYRLRLGSCRFAAVFGRGFVLRLYWYTDGTRGSGSTTPAVVCPSSPERKAGRRARPERPDS